MGSLFEVMLRAASLDGRARLGRGRMHRLRESM